MLEKVSMGECSLGWMRSLAQVAMDAPQGTQGEGGGGGGSWTPQGGLHMKKINWINRGSLVSIKCLSAC